MKLSGRQRLGAIRGENRGFPLAEQLLERWGYDTGRVHAAVFTALGGGHRDLHDLSGAQFGAALGWLHEASRRSGSARFYRPGWEEQRSPSGRSLPAHPPSTAKTPTSDASWPATDRCHRWTMSGWLMRLPMFPRMRTLLAYAEMTRSVDLPIEATVDWLKPLNQKLRQRMTLCRQSLSAYP